MGEILIFLLTLCILSALYSRISAIVRAYLAIRSLKSDANAEILDTRCPLLSFFKHSARPDTVIRIGERVYLVRYIYGRGKNTFLHFASERFYVTFKKQWLPGISRVRATARYKKLSEGSYNTASSRRVRMLPELCIPDEYKDSETVPVLIFIRPPSEITYVSEERTAIKLAFTGDSYHTSKLFTAETFAIYAEREYRKNEQK